MPSLTISLLDAYRGQGIGSQLLETLLAALRKKSKGRFPVRLKSQSRLFSLSEIRFSYP